MLLRASAKTKQGERRDRDAVPGSWVSRDLDDEKGLAILRGEKLTLGKGHKCKGPEAGWLERVSEGEELGAMRSGRLIVGGSVGRAKGLFSF